MNRVHFIINLIKGRFANYVLKKAQEVGLSQGQPRVLEYLAEHDGCPQSAICDFWELDRSTVAGLVKRMERDGLIRCEDEQKDKRKKKIHMTPKGAELWKKMKPYINKMDETAFKGFTNEEKEQLLELLERMHNNLKKLQ